ncbi:MAG: transporter substrate-binding protein, partial [Burkholderiales bacterium]|nr:transporter substrate-binding protein [Burkholderiales bacterium]
AGGTAAAIGPWFIKDLHAADEIKIAGIHDASGGLDLLGRPMIDVLTLAVEETNAAGGLLGKPIKLINYDAQSNIQYYTQYATQAATKDKVAVVHAGITSASREAIRPVLKRFNTLYFYNTLYEGGVCDRNCFCTGSTPAQTVQKLIPTAMKKFNGKKIYVLAADYNYGQITSKWVKKYTQDEGGSIVSIDFFPLDVTDFGPTIKKIQAAKPDIIMSVLVGGSHISFYRQWAAAGMKKQIPMASTTFGLGNEHVVVSAEEGNGILASYAYFHEVAAPANQEFIKRYFKRFGDKAAPLTEVAAMTYHGFQMWAEAAKKAGTVDRMKVIEALESGISYQGPAGKTTIDPATHHDILDVYIGEVDNKKFKLLESFSQQPPADTAAVCDLKKKPNDNQQYVIDVKV